MSTLTTHPSEVEQWIQSQAEVNRQTDDIAFNVKYLARHILDHELELFEVDAEADVLQQNYSELGESDVHALGIVVHQQLDSEMGQYVSLGDGTVNYAQAGIDALDMSDPASWFEFERRIEERIDEELILELETNQRMREGGIKVFASPSPTHHEADPDVAISFNYDDRTMLRFQTLSSDGQTKAMISFSLFDAPAPAWAAYFNEKYGAAIEPTAIAVMRFCNELPLQHGSIGGLLTGLVEGVKKYVDENAAENLDRQLDAFLTEQQDLQEQTTFYAHEKLKFQKEIALCLNGWATPKLKQKIDSAMESLTTEHQQELAKRYFEGNLKVDDYVVEILLKLNAVTTAHRAGLATRNYRTFKRVAHGVGLENAIVMAENERAIRQAIEQGMNADAMEQRAEQMIARAGLECRGGCSAAIVDLFSAAAKDAKKAGLKGTLYEDDDLNRNSKCNCKLIGKKAKVIADGKNALCVTCGDFEVNGTRGNLKKTKKAA